MQAWAYDHSGNHMTRQPLEIGYEVDWKRRGARGSYRARVIELKGDKVKLQLLKYSDNPRADLSAARPVWTKPTFLRIYSPITKSPEYRAMDEAQMRIEDAGRYYEEP